MPIASVFTKLHSNQTYVRHPSHPLTTLPNTSPIAQPSSPPSAAHAPPPLPYPQATHGPSLHSTRWHSPSSSPLFFVPSSFSHFADYSLCQLIPLSGSVFGFHAHRSVSGFLVRRTMRHLQLDLLYLFLLLSLSRLALRCFGVVGAFCAG